MVPLQLFLLWYDFQIDILKRLQRETFSDLMKVRDRQDKVERILSLYGTAKGSPFQEASTLVKGDMDLLGAFLMINNADNQDYDALSEAEIRTGIDSRFTFETTVRGIDTLGVEFVTIQKHKNNLGDASGSSLSLAKVFYMANVSDWFSAIAIPMGAKGRDVAIMTDPSHQVQLKCLIVVKGLDFVAVGIRLGTLDLMVLLSS